MTVDVRLVSVEIYDVEDSPGDVSLLCWTQLVADPDVIQPEIVTVTGLPTASGLIEELEGRADVNYV